MCLLRSLFSHCTFFVPAPGSFFAFEARFALDCKTLCSQDPRCKNGVTNSESSSENAPQNPNESLPFVWVFYIMEGEVLSVFLAEIFSGDCPFSFCGFPKFGPS